MRGLLQQSLLALLLIAGWAALAQASLQLPQETRDTGFDPTRVASSGTPTLPPSPMPNHGTPGGQALTAPATSIVREQQSSNQANPNDGTNDLGAAGTQSNTLRSNQNGSLRIGETASVDVDGFDVSAQATAEPQSDGPTLDPPKRTGLKLEPPSSTRITNPRDATKDWAKPELMTTFVSLALVLAAFFVLVWFMKRSKPGSSQMLPSDAVEVLGRKVMSGKQQLNLVRFGNKLLLVSVTQSTTETLGEITDQAEVERILAMCSTSRNGSISDTFRQVLSQLGTENTNSGFLADSANESQLTNASESQDEEVVPTSRRRRWF